MSKQKAINWDVLMDKFYNAVPSMIFIVLILIFLGMVTLGILELRKVGIKAQKECDIYFKDIEKLQTSERRFNTALNTDVKSGQYIQIEDVAGRINRGYLIGTSERVITLKLYSFNRKKIIFSIKKQDIRTETLLENPE